MDLDEIRLALGRQAPPSVAALQAAVHEANTLAPDLIELVERVRCGSMLLPWQENLLFYSLHAVAAASERAAWPALVGLLDLQGWQLNRLLGEDYSSIVLQVALTLYGGGADALYAALERRLTDPGIRWALFEVLARLAWEGQTDRHRLTALIDRFDAEAMAPPGDAAWEGWASAIGLLGLRDRAGRVRESWNNGRLLLNDEEEQAAWLELLATAEAHPDDPDRFVELGIERLTDATVCLQDDDPWDDEDKDEDSDPAASFCLTDAERDWLDDFLGSDELLPEAMSLPCLDGFFTALVIGPEPIMPSEYLPEIWGTTPGAPEFEDSEQAEFVTGLLMRHWNTIAARIESGYPIMPLIRRHSLAIDVSEWAEGFMCGVALREDAWRTLFSDRQGASIVGLIASLGGEPDDEDAMAPPKEVTDAAEQLPEMIAAIAEFWRTRRINPPPHHESKVGRNDPCPCASGRKFKKCCGAPGRVLS